MANTCELKGQRFGKLTVLEKTEKRENRYAIWRCMCDCGNECYVSTRYLHRGTVKNCGCEPKKTLQWGRAPADITGMTFGKLTALRRVENRGTRTVWLCRCECGNEVEVSTQYLRSGRTKSCGCLVHAPRTKALQK